MSFNHYLFTFLLTSFLLSSLFTNTCSKFFTCCFSTKETRIQPFDLPERSSSNNSSLKSMCVETADQQTFILPDITLTPPSPTPSRTNSETSETPKSFFHLQKPKPCFYAPR